MAPVVIPDDADFGKAEGRIALLLETQYFYTDTEAGETAKCAVEIIATQIGSNA